MRREFDKDHKIHRLYVHWDVSTQCKLKCSYCYAWKNYGNDWGKIASWDKQKIILHTLSRAKLPIFLGLLGGEPTDHPHYAELIERCHNIISKHQDGRLYITTNGLQPTEFFATHPFFNNTYFLFSFHPEYESRYGDGFTLLLDNIRAVLARGFRIKVNVMLHHKKKYWARTQKFVDELETIKGIEIHPHFTYADCDVHQLTEYHSKFYKEFERFKFYPPYFVFDDCNNTTVLNDYEVFTQDVAHFKGWNCWNNNYEITWNGIVNQFCFDDYTDLMHDLSYFERIEEIKPKICPHNSCNCDGLLKIYKETDDGKNG